MMTKFWVVLLIACGGARVQAGDWPQILGPNRDGAAVGEVLPDRLTDDQVKTEWRYPLGEGFAGPAVRDGRVVVFHRVDGRERVEALDAASGRSLWKTEFATDYRGAMNPDSGPRCVPLIHGDFVYVFGAGGDLHGLRWKDGEKVWSRAAAKDFTAPDGYFGFGSTPIVAGGHLLVNVGGSGGSGIVAFDLKTGETAWTSTNERATYSSPILFSRNGEDTAFFVTRLQAVGLDPVTGKERFRFPFGRRGPTVNAAVPLRVGERLFLSASYGVGAQLMDVSGPAPKSVWAKQDVMASQYATSVYLDGFLYGVDGREDLGDAVYQCIDAKTGGLRWSEKNLGTAHTIRVGKKLLLLGLDGRLTLVDASPDSFRSLGQVSVADDTTRALPALSGGRLYLRTNDGRGGQLLCVRVSLPPK